MLKFPVALVGMAMLFSTSAFTYENNLPKITYSPAQPQAGEAFNLRVSGTWTNGCGGQVTSSAPDGYDITVRLKVNSSLICTAVLSPFDVSLLPFSGANRSVRGVYRVRAYIEDTAATGSQRLVAFALVPVVDSSKRAPSPEVGMWWADSTGEYPTSGPGLGHLFERQGNSFAFNSQIYDATGKATWVVGSGVTTGGAASGKTYTGDQGQVLFQPYRSPSIMQRGEFSVQFLSSSRAVLWFSEASGEGALDTLRLMPMSISRFNFALGAPSEIYSGNWTLIVAPTGSRLTPRSYKFGAVRIGAQGLHAYEDADRSRLICGQITADRPYPSSCSLESSQGQVIATFDDLGLDTMNGTESNSSLRTVLQRISE
jgi:hypothetical protein